jgi:hypothetical protein
MEPVNQHVLDELLASANVDAADPARHIGRQLAFARPPARTVVVHLGEAADRVAEVVSIVLAMDGGWFLIPRYGTAAQLALVEAGAEAAAVSFAPSERAILGRYLCQRPMDLGATSADLYFLGASGTVLVTWDHHTADEGLTVEFRRVDDSHRLLASLNELGTEMEVYCAPG